jgi:hypothetical protein
MLPETILSNFKPVVGLEGTLLVVTVLPYSFPHLLTEGRRQVRREHLHMGMSSTLVHSSPHHCSLISL